MRTTLNVDNDLLRHLKQEALKTRLSLRQVLNAALRRGLASSRPVRPRASYTCPAFRMGEPTINLDKALTLAANLEDAEVLRELELRK